jgi:hypothetical protein
MPPRNINSPSPPDVDILLGEVVWVESSSSRDAGRTFAAYLEGSRITFR